MRTHRNNFARIVLLFEAICCLGLATALGQNNAQSNKAIVRTIDVSVIGMVTDVENQPIEFATVVLYNRDSTMTTATVTEVNGHFQMQAQVGEGAFLRVDFLGFEQKTIPLSAETGPLTIILQSASTVLEEVTVTSRKPLLEQKPDRLIVNLSASLSTTGQSARQALGRAPGVLINDRTKEISITGRSGTQLMINGRMIRGSGDLLLSQLESISADQIDRIEIIHQPSAKYDSEGTGGIIHIVLKRNENKGFSGAADVNAGYGWGPKYGGNFLFNLRGIRYNLYGDINGMSSKSDRGFWNENRRYLFEENWYEALTINSIQRNEQRSAAGNLGLDIFLPKTTLGVRGGFTDWFWEFESRSVTNQYIKDELTSRQVYDIRPTSLTDNYYINFNIEKKIRDSDQLTFDIDFAKYIFQSPGEFTNTQPEAGELQGIEVQRDAPLSLFTIRSDYLSHLPLDLQLEFGGKYTRSNMRNNATVLNRVDGEWTRNDLFSTVDDFDEQILASYATFKKDLSARSKLELGLRYEFYQFDIVSTNDEQNQSRKNGNFFPILHYNYSIDSTRSINVSYSRRVTRPKFSQLSSFFIFSSPSSLVTGGDPLLRPSFSHLGKLSYQYNALLFSLEYSNEQNFISWHNTVIKEQHTQFSRPVNFDRLSIWSFSSSFPLHIGRDWNANVTLIGQYRTLKDLSVRPFPFRLSKGNIMIQMSHEIRLSKTFSADFSGNYISPYVHGDQIMQSIAALNLGVQKQFGANQHITLGISDVLRTAAWHRWSYHDKVQDIQSWGDHNFGVRTYMLTYSLKFGNQKLKGQRSRTTASEDERQRI